MKHLRNRTILLLLAAQLLSLFSCGGTTETTDPADTSAVGQTEETVPAETEILPDLPEITFDGAEYQVLHWDNGVGHVHTHFEYDAEELNGELLNDAIYQRNLEIEEQYDVTITTLGSKEPAGQVKKDVTAGDSSYQVVADWPTRLADLSTQGMMQDFHKIPYIDTEKPWWDHNSIESFTVNNKLFLITGDYVLYDKQRILIIFFNHSLSDKLGIPDLYETVQEGKWTIDLMNSYTELARNDLNGDGKMDPMDDQFGMISGSYTYMPYLLFGVGSRYSQPEADGSFSLAIDNERTIDAIQKLNGTFASDTTVYHEVISQKIPVMQLFESGRGLFHHEVSQVTRMLDMEDAYGLIPQPKFDEAQENYLSGVQYEWSGSIAVPATIAGDKLEMTGVLLEALSALSHKTTYPTFIEDILQSKKAPDRESADMLRLIYANITYDLFGVFQFGKLPQLVYDNIYKKQGEGFTSTIASNQEKIMAAYDKVYQKFTEMDN